MILLKLEGITKNFGGLTAVSTLDMSVDSGDIVGLIGPNGAGKTTVFNLITTVFNLITGYIRPRKGRVLFKGKDITNKKPHTVTKYGIARTFQASSVFNDFTTLQNIILACQLKHGASIWQTPFHLPSSRRKDEHILSRAFEILELVGMSAKANELAKNLPHGHKRSLGIGLALATEPQILLLDEPLAGMNGEEISQTVEIINRLWQRGTTILLIEHNMKVALSLCQKIVVLNFGKKIAEGTPDEIKNDAGVIQAYLGDLEHAT
jgi:branched-chain amino acid transport system ATP-binding protein